MLLRKGIPCRLCGIQGLILMAARFPYYKEIALLLLILAGYILHSVYMGSFTVNCATDISSLVAAQDITTKLDSFSSKIGQPIHNLITAFQHSRLPPLYALNAVLITKIIGRNWTMMNIVNNFPYLFILLVFCYLTGREIKDKETGILASVLIALYPLVYGSFRLYCIDFSIMAMTVMSFYFLLRSKNFQKTPETIVFALCCGWGMLLKDPFGCFIAGPTLYALFCRCNHPQNPEKGILSRPANILIAAVLFLIVISPYYFNITILKFILIDRQISNEPAQHAWYTFDNLRLFTTGLWENQLSPPFFIAFIIGLYFVVKHKYLTSVKPMIFLWIVVPTVIVLFMNNQKSVRYLLPLMPAYALVTAAGLRTILWTRRGIVIVCIILVAGLLQYRYISYGSSDISINIMGKQWHYFSRSELNQKFSDMQNTGERMQGIYQGLMERYRQSGNKSTLNLLIPLRITSGFTDFIDIYFWFQNSKTTINTISLLEKGIETLEQIYQDRNKIDAILFLLPKEKIPLIRRDFHLPFAILQEYYSPWNSNIIRNYQLMTAADWAVHERTWNKLEREFPQKKLLYNDAEIEVYLFSRSQ